MKKLLIITALLLLFSHSKLHAQSTAGQATVCILTTTGCPGSAKSCCLPVSITNPLPVR